MQTTPVIDLPSPPLEQLLTDPGAEEQGRLKHLYFADNYSVLADPASSGRWITDEDGSKIWLLGIRSEGAYSIGLIINKFQLTGESMLFVYNEDRSRILGAFTKENNNEADILPVSHIPGERIYIQLEMPSGQSDYGELMIEEAAVAYLPVFADNPYKDSRFGMSGNCNIDINCPEGDNWQDLKRSVCRILINGNKWCSGTLINTAINSKEPYILTAAHCIGSQGEANRSVFYFYYESPSCDGPDGVTDHQISGANLIATGDSLGESMNRDSLDFSLVRLNVQPPVNFRVYYAGWNRTLMPATETVTIHHPLGDVKKISMDQDPPQTNYHKDKYYPEYVLNSHWRILQWDLATTEAGSSGCPLFDQDQRLVGLLTGGEADCASSINDYFTKFDYSWNYYDKPYMNLSAWLDPLNSGTFSVDGLDYNSQVNIPESDNLAVYPNPGTGHYLIRLNRNSSEAGRLLLFTSAGSLIRTISIHKENFIRFEMDDCPPGIYFTRLVFSDEVYKAKIVHLPD